MDISKCFPTKFLKAADLGDRSVTVVIESVQMMDMADDTDKPKPVVYFKGKEKGLVLNITNSNSIAEICGDSVETDDWIKETIVLFSTKVDYAGKRVDAIRVEKPKPKTRAQSKNTVKETIDDATEPDAEEDIPF